VVDTAKFLGAAGKLFTAMLTVWAVLLPQLFCADTLNVPAVALFAKSTVTELPVPLIVAPVPL
jgi:hypothetical protein